MDETASQNSDESKNGKKLKTLRPIILLRRNSSNNVNPNKSCPQEINALTSVDKKYAKKHCHVVNAKSKPFVPVVKTEIIETSTPVLWNKNLKAAAVKQPVIQNVWHQKMIVNPMIKEKLRMQESFSLPTQIVQLPQKNLMQQNSIGLPQTFQHNAPQPLFANTQFQNVSQITVPNTVNPVVQFGNDQYSTQPNFHCSQYFYSPIVQNPANPLQLSLQENRQFFCQHAQPHSIVSDGAILQTYSNSTFVQNSPLEQNMGVQREVTHQSSIHSQFDSIADDSLTNITWLGKMGVNNFMPVPLEKEKKLERNDKRGRPPYSYMALIQFAINSSATGRMTLRQIYEWIEEKFPYFKTAKPGWKNSIRHNLSLHDLFVREVCNGSKASYWTLRPDLNIRPLTLDSVGTSPPQGPIWSLQSIGQGHKPILPRLPYCSRPYVLLPIPLLQNSKESSTNSSKVVSVDSTESYTQDASTSSSLLVDSGLHSDMSYCTPNFSNKTFSAVSDASSNLHSDSGLKSAKKNSDSLLSQVNKSSHKRSRKEPLKTLNDSLNSSLQFKEEMNSPPKTPTPFPKKLEKNIDINSSKPLIVGLSEESFSELLNDLGSPYKTYLTHESGQSKLSPQMESAKKRRRSWGSPDSIGSGLELQSKVKAANEKTPTRQHIRRTKSDLIDLAHDMKHNDVLPTSTPLLKDKWKKSNQRFVKLDEVENKENFSPTKTFLTKSANWQLGETSRSKNPLLTPSPILNSHECNDIETNFFEDIIGSVFKTPEKPSAPVRHFDTLSPERPPGSSRAVTFHGSVSAGGVGEKCDINKTSNPMFYTLNSSDEEPLNTSFSKLLDISSGNNSFCRLPSNFPELDLNLSWSNLPTI